MNEFRQQISAALWIISANGEGLGIATKAALLGGNVEQANEPRPPGQWRNLAVNFLASVIFESLPHPHSEPIELDEDDTFPWAFDLQNEPCKRTDPEVGECRQVQACSPAFESSEGDQCLPQSKVETCACDSSIPPAVTRIFPFGVVRDASSALCKQMQAAVEIIYCHGEVPFSTKTFFYGDKKTAHSVQDRRQVLVDAVAFWHQFENHHELLEVLDAIPLEQLRANKYGYSVYPKLSGDSVGE